MSEQIKHYTAHWHTSPYPLLVGFGTCLFMPWAFMLHFNYGASLPALVCLALGVVMMIIGGVGWAGETIGVIDDEGWSPSAMFMFIGTEVMTIAGVMAGYWVARIGAPVWPPEGTPDIEAPLVATIILLLSSITIGLARKNELAGNASGFVAMTVATIIIWIGFMASVISGWGHLSDQGFTIGINAFATALYGFTGIHVAHLMIGLLVMLTVLPTALKGRLSPSYTRSMTMYVHFVNILGVVALMQVYYW